MSSFELNKFAAAILLAGIIAMVSGFLAEALVKPMPLAKPAYVVAGVEEKSSHFWVARELASPHSFKHSRA